MRPRPTWWMRRTRAETGAVAIVVSVSMVLLAVTAALVLDFGIARLDRTSNKLTADASVMAGLQAMYDTEGERKSWRAVCTAISYLRANGPELTTATGTFTTGGGGAVGGDPCTTTGYQDLTCLPDDQSTWARWDGTAGDGRIAIQIRSGYLLPDPAFTEDAALSADTGVADAAGCDQLAVIIRESRSPGLGALATDEDTVTTIRSVGRASSDGMSDVVPALILLERTECNALQVGSSASFIEVYGSGSAPGTIHADSLGSGSTCTSGSGGYVMHGKAAKHIWAHAATSGSPRRPGLISTVASSSAPGAVPARATDGAANTCAETLTGTCSAAVGGNLIGRRPPDVRYLSGVRNAVAAAEPLYNATSTPAGYVAQGGSCTFGSGTNTTSSPVFVNCPNGARIDGTYTFTNAPSVVFNGPLEVKPSATLAAPKATQFYVRGRTTSGSLQGLTVAGNLNVNNNAVGTSCPGLTAAPRAKLVVGFGPFTGGSTAVVRMCHTSVLMAGNSGTPGCPFPTTVGIAPYSNACQGFLNIGAGATVDWTAPDLIRTRVATIAETNTYLEDLAFWTETSSGNGLGGGGAVTVSGVFVAPNAYPFLLGGGSDNTARQNAQFVARALEVKGNSTVVMQPNPRNSITLPAPAVYLLVR